MISGPSIPGPGPSQPFSYMETLWQVDRQSSTSGQLGAGLQVSLNHSISIRSDQLLVN